MEGIREYENMRWQILTLTQPSRKWYLRRLVSHLRSQLVDGVEHVVVFSNPALTVGANRQLMIDCATAEYVNFVDDDDLVANDYVASILPLLASSPDMVGYRLQMYVDGVRLPKLTYHNPAGSGWNEDENGYYRDISHVNPIRREIALLAKFDGGFGEDERWANQIRETRRVNVFCYVDRVMYHYYYRSEKNDGVAA